MGSQQRETTYQIKIQALAENFENVQKQLKNLNKDGSLDNYAKKWDAIGKKIEKLKEVSNQPESKGMFGTLGRDIGSVEQRMEDFSKEFIKLAEELSKTGIHILDKAEIEKVNKLTSALEALEKAQKNTQSAIDSKTKERQGVLNRKADAERRKAFLESEQNKARNTFNTGIGKEKTDYNADLAAKRKAADDAAAELKKIQEGRKRDEERAEKAGKKRVVYQDKYSTAKFEEAKKKKKETKSDYDTHKASWTKEKEKTYKDAEKDIESYNTKIKNCESSIADLDDKAEKLQKTIEQLISDKANQNTDDYVNAYKEMLSVLGKSETEITELSKDFKNLTPEQKAEEFEKLKEEIVNLRTEALAPVVQVLDETKAGLEKTTEAADETKDEIKNGAEAWEEYTEAQQKADAIKDRIKDFVGMAGAAKVLKAALRDAYATIKELDAAMAEIAVVTDFSVGDMWEQLPIYTESANDLGVAIHEVYEASALYYQQGLKTEQVTAMTTETLKMMKIAGLSAEDATNRMTAAIRGFNMELNETSAQRVADVYAELAAITASDTGQISTAMTKTASIASSAGMEFETTAAFLAQIIETTQESAETAGTAMKTVIARFQELKKAPGEIGEVDGEIVDANAIETALRSVGVALRDSSGQFRELDDVFLELSGKWDSLDKNTQRYIATIAAGSRQQSRFIAMMSNNARTTELVAAANASAGASNKQYEKTLETMESKLQRLSNAWDEFTMSIVNPSWVKIAVDGLTSVLNTINKITNAFGDSENSLIDFGKGFNDIFNSFTKIGLLISAFNLAKLAFQKFSQFITDTAKKWGTTIGQGIVGEVKKGLDQVDQTIQQKNQQAKNSNEQTSNNQQSHKDIKTISRDEGGRFRDEKGRFMSQTAFDNEVVNSPNEKSKNKTPSLFKQMASGAKSGWNKGKDQKALNLAKKENATLVKLIKTKEKNGSLNDRQQKQYDELSKKYAKNNELIQKNEEIKKENNTTSEKFGNTLNGLGTALTLTGVATGMLSGMLENMGMEEEAATVAKLGTAITMLGSTLTFVGVVQDFVNKGTWASVKANIADAASWVAKTIAAGGFLAVILIITIALIALIAIIALFIWQSSQPTDAEKNLEKTKKAAEEASEAAERATKSYEELNDALSNLDGKYKALEDLTKGTKEWNKAVLETNSQVLDLIDKYPELASLVTNEDGVLKLDIESDEVQQVLAKSQQSALFAQSTAAVANAKVSMAELDVNIEDSKIFDKLRYEATREASRRVRSQDPEATVAYQSGESDKYIDKIQNEMVKDYAKQYAMGDLTEEELQRLAGASDDVVQELKRFGEQLVAAETEMSVAMSTMASNAVATFGETLSDEQRTRALATTQSTIESTHQKNKENFSGYRTEGKATLNEDELAVAQRAVENQYGPGASISSNGLVTYKEGDETKTKDLSDEEMKELILSQQTYEDSIKKVEATEDAFNSLTRVFEDEKTANNILTGNLNKAELEALDSKNIDYLYGQLGEAGEIIYGSAEEFRKQIEKTKSDVKQAYAKSDKINKEIGIGDVSFWKEISSNAAKGLSESLKTVYEKTGTEGAKAIESQFATLSAQLDNKKFEEIVALYNGIDINNQQALLDVEYKLISQYGVSKESAEGLTAAFVENNKVIDQLALSVLSINKFTAALVKVEEAMQKAEDAAWDYEQALRSGNKDQVKTSIQDQIAAYQEQAAESKGATQAAIDNLAKIYAAGATKVSGYDFRKLVTVSDDGKNVYQTNDQVVAYSKIGNKEIREAFEEWFADLQSGSSDITTAEKTPKDSLVAIQGIEDTLKDSYTELRDRAIEAVNQHLEKQISLQEEQINVERNAFNNLINKVQQQIDEDRQARQNEEAQENLNNAYNQLSLMQMDTAGGNQLGVAQLQDDIAKQEQEYQDTLIDQALQNLQDANERAFEQREQQISLQSEALESYQRSEEYQSNIDAMMNNLLNNGEESELYKLLEKAEQQGMSPAQKTDWEIMLSGQLASADLYYKMFAEGSESNPYNIVTKAIGDVEEVLSEANLGSIAEQIATAPFITELSGKGFAEKELQGKTVSELQKMQAFTNRESSNSDIASLKNKLDKYGIGFQSKEDYYAENASAIASNSSFDTYGAYLQKLVNKHEKEEEEKVVKVDTGKAGAPYANPDAQLHEGYAWLEGTPAINDDDQTKEASYINAVSALKENYPGIGMGGTVWNEEDAAGGYDESGAQKIGGTWYRFTTGAIIPNELVPQELLDQPPKTEQIAAFNDPQGTFWMGVWNGSSFNRIKDMEDYSKIKALLAGRFKTGGLADFTGPAWLDGTKSRPEYVLNADQTERFFSLIDVLEGFDKNPTTTEKSGDSYIDVDINVESIASDYDVEQLADKIRSMIYDDATYRNVNNVSHIR